MDGSRKDGLGKLVDKLTLHQPLDRTGTVSRIVAACHHVILESLCELDGDTFLGEPVLKLLHLDMKNITDVILSQRIEHYDLIDSVQELRPYRSLEHVHHLLLTLVQKLTSCGDRPHLLGRINAWLSDGRKPVHIALDDVRAHIGGHYKDCVLEVHSTALVVGQTAVVQNLQKDVEHIRMRLLDLIQQDD